MFTQHPKDALLLNYLFEKIDIQCEACDTIIKLDDNLSVDTISVVLIRKKIQFKEMYIKQKKKELLRIDC